MNPSHPSPEELLRQWLESSEPIPPPAGLDPAVIETVIALNPHRAMPAQVSFEQIVRSVTSGPMLAQETESAAATKLAAHIDNDPSASDTSTTSTQAQEAVHILRPGLAPPPRVTIDEVLQSVRVGPLAAPRAQAEQGSPPVNKGMGRWAFSGVGVFAMAATALLFVLPIADEAPPSVLHAPASDALDANEAGSIPRKNTMAEQTEAVKEEALLTHQPSITSKSPARKKMKSSGPSKKHADSSPMPKTQPAAPAQFRSRSAGTAGFTSSGGPQFREAPIHGQDEMDMMDEMEADPTDLDRILTESIRIEPEAAAALGGTGQAEMTAGAVAPLGFMEEEDEFDAIGSLADEFPVDQDLYVIALELHVDGKPLQALEVIKQALDGTIELEPRKKIELLRLKAAVLLVLGHDELATEAQMHAEQIESMN